MKILSVCIGTARIGGLRSTPYYSSITDSYEWNLSLIEATIPKVYGVNHICLSKESNAKALQRLNEIKHCFKNIAINEKDRVAFIFSEEDDKVIAIGHYESDFWIDVIDEFKVKRFSDLNIVIKELRVF